MSCLLYNINSYTCEYDLNLMPTKVGKYDVVFEDGNIIGSFLFIFHTM